MRYTAAVVGLLTATLLTACATSAGRPELAGKAEEHKGERMLAQHEYDLRAERREEARRFARERERTSTVVRTCRVDANGRQVCN